MTTDKTIIEKRIESFDNSIENNSMEINTDTPDIQTVEPTDTQVNVQSDVFIHPTIESLKQSIDYILSNNFDEITSNSFIIILKYLYNILYNNKQLKYLIINTLNKIYQTKVMNVIGIHNLLQNLGFELFSTQNSTSTSTLTSIFQTNIQKKSEINLQSNFDRNLHTNFQTKLIENININNKNYKLNNNININYINNCYQLIRNLLINEFNINSLNIPEFSFSMIQSKELTNQKEIVEEFDPFKSVIVRNAPQVS